MQTSIYVQYISSVFRSSCFQLTIQCHPSGQFVVEVNRTSTAMTLLDSHDLALLLTEEYILCASTLSPMFVLFSSIRVLQRPTTMARIIRVPCVGHVRKSLGKMAMGEA